MTVPFLYIFAIYLNKRMKIWGEKNVLFNQLETKIIINSLSFFKEIKIYDLKNSFINKVEGYLIDTLVFLFIDDNEILEMNKKFLKHD